MKNTQSAADLFVLLERAFRRRARDCEQCAFTLPFLMPARNGDSNWSVVAAAACSERCRLLLDELVAEHQLAYQLADGDGPPVGARRVRARPQ